MYSYISLLKYYVASAERERYCQLCGLSARAVAISVACDDRARCGQCCGLCLAHALRPVLWPVMSARAAASPVAYDESGRCGK